MKWIGISLVFYRNDEAFYQLSEFDLKEIRMVNNKEVSACVVDLSKKAWVSMPLLYQAAKLITDYYPAVNFNWENTFCYIEHSDYIKSACDIVNLAKFEEKGDIAKVIQEVNATRRTSEIEKREIRDIVMSNLKDYGLINY